MERSNQNWNGGIGDQNDMNNESGNLHFDSLDENDNLRSSSADEGEYDADETLEADYAEGSEEDSAGGWDSEESFDNEEDL